MRIYDTKMYVLNCCEATTLFHGNTQYIGLYFKEVHIEDEVLHGLVMRFIPILGSHLFTSEVETKCTYVEHNFCGAVSNSSLIVAKIYIRFQ